MEQCEVLKRWKEHIESLCDLDNSSSMLQIEDEAAVMEDQIDYNIFRMEMR